MAKPAITATRSGGRDGVVRIEVGDDGMDRFTQAIDIHAVNSGLFHLRPVGIVTAQPVGKGQHIFIAPHPRGKPQEWIATLRARRVVANIVIDARNIRPIAFDSDDIEPVVFDQPTRDRRTGRIEFMRTMRRFAQQYDPRIAKPVECRAKAFCVDLEQRFARFAQDLHCGIPVGWGAQLGRGRHAPVCAGHATSLPTADMTP